MRISLRSDWGRGAAAVLMVLFGNTAGHTQQLRVLGIDVSTYQGSISVANWATLKRATNQQVGGVYGDGRDFVFIRSSRGGTTGEDHRQGGYPSGNNTFFSQSERYDDPYYVQNINRATAAGLFAGSYHFARPDVVASSTNSDGTTVGVANTGTDEANHFIEMAGPWMRPGFLPPILDLESGNTVRTDNQMAQFCVDFSDRIYAVMGIRPGIYLNGNYASSVLQTATAPSPSQIVAALPTLWSARWPNQSNPDAIDVQNGQPKDSYTPIYGPWDDAPNPANPWKFWQYASTGRLNGIANGTANCDIDVAQGGMEFLKDQLIPALWLSDADGDWNTLGNWNSGLTPVAPVPGPGQLTPVGTQTLPTPRLPGADDTVILDRPSASVTVTLSSGNQNIRKLYAREALNLTGGSLTINYTPSWDSTIIGAEFSAPVTLGGTANLSVNTLQVDAAQAFTVAGGSLTFNAINLMPGATPARLVIGGDITLSSLLSGDSTIAVGSGTGSLAYVDLNGASHAWNVVSGSSISVQTVVKNGGLSKIGGGALSLEAPNQYAGGTVVSVGRLYVNNASGSGTGSGTVTVNGGTLGGTGAIAGSTVINSSGVLAPGAASIGSLAFSTPPTLNGTTFLRIDSDGGSASADQIIVSSGTLTFGGTLMVSNAGPALVGGEAFTNFIAPARSGAFESVSLPPLAAGLNWYLGDMTPFGRIKVNRSPSAGVLTFTNIPGGELQIPLASLLDGATDADGDALALDSINLVSTNGVALSTNASFLLYSNSLNPADRISFTLTDGHGGTATGYVYIAASARGQFGAQPVVSSAAATVQFFGSPQGVYYLERSTNLTDWITISTNTMPANGVRSYMDDFGDLAAVPAAAFYRLRW